MRAQAGAGTPRPWPGKTVPYVIDKQYNNQERQTIEKGFKHLSSQIGNCVQFVPRSNQQDYLYVIPGKGCNSDIGHKGGKQWMVLDHSCIVRGIDTTVIHEAGHTLGFDHTQCRSDRDKFLQVFLDRVQPNMRHNFQKKSTNNEKFVPFDYSSIMIYAPTDFAIDKKKPTMVPTDPNARLLTYNERPELSKLDIQMIKKLYQCA